MSLQPGIDAMDPWATVPENEDAFGDLASIVLHDGDALPFGTGIVTPEFPGGNAPIPTTDLNVALGLADSPVTMIQLESPPASSSGISGLAPLAFVAFVAFALLGGSK